MKNLYSTSTIKEKVLILGGNGFIGGTIREYLQNQSIECYSPVRKKCDLLNLKNIESYLHRFSNQTVHVIFCAAIPRRTDDSQKSMEHNINILSNFIKCSKSISLSSFIYLSSIDVYDKSHGRITECTPVLPVGYYALSKANSEKMLIDSLLETPLMILRLPGIYGKGDRGNSIISSLAKKIKDGSTIKLDSNKSPMRDYVKINDLCKIIQFLIERPHNGTYNLSTGKSMMISEIVALIEKALVKNAKIDFVKMSSQNDDIYISNHKICKVIENLTFTSMEIGIVDHIMSHYK